MRKVIRINCIVIALIFAALAALGVFVCMLFEEKLSTSALSHGQGTKEDPYKIYTATELVNLQELVASDHCKDYTEGKYFRLEKDLSIASNTTNETINGFYGILDGNGHSIKIRGKGLFYRVANGGRIENTVFKINLNTLKFTTTFGVAYTIDKGAVVTDCTVKGNFDLLVPEQTKNLNLSIRCAGVSISNYGLIENCTFDYDVTTSGYSKCSAVMYFAGITIGSGGEIKCCTINAQMEIIMNTTGLYFYGISRNDIATDCTFNGDIILRKNPNSNVLGIATRLYMLGQSVENCTFNGDVTFDFRGSSKGRYNEIQFASDDSTYVHNGKIIEIFD